MAPDPLSSAIPTGLARLWPKRIAWRLTLGLGALVLMVLLALVQTAWQLRLVSDVTQRFATGDMQRLLRVQALSLQTEGVGSALVRLVHAPRADRVKEYADVDARNRSIDGIIESLSDELKDPEQEATLRRLVACRAMYAQAFIATVDEIEGDNMQAAARALNDQVNPALTAMLRESGTLLQRERQRVEAQLSDARVLFGRVAMWVGLLSLLAIALATYLAWRTTRSVVAPLARLERAAHHIAQGDYAHQVQTTGTEEIDRVGQALNTMSDAVSQREQQIVRLAYQDSLTGLPNRTALLNPQHPGPEGANTLVLVDLARLKIINETLGYTTGDTLIKELGVRASLVLGAAARRGLIGPQWVVARLSGGTFAAAFQADQRSAVEQLHADLDEATTASVACSGHSVDLSLSCGFADTTDTGNGTVGALLRNAEVALHSAKRAALSHAWYSAAQEAARLDHLGLVSDLRAAVAQSQLQMWLQPKFSLAGTGQPVGAEALVRWIHPQRGFVSPAEFVPFAEQTGYITMVTDWMLDQALQTLQAWQTTHPALSIAVNVSTRDLQDAGFAQRVGQKVARSGINPQRLRLEITESGLMEDAQKSVELLHALRAVGIPLSIDDFGTGYSSLAYLQKLPVSELKIDRSFIDGIDKAPRTQKLVKAMIEMGHGMDLFVTAEGVETEAERSTIAQLGCDVMQGYLGSRPLYGAQLQAWLDSVTEAPALSAK
ncbi:EAL domain-containing protein [Rhodoferax saidenbachensis]|uniref:Diguanylate cyclase (GGDEF)-like protein n=1 Tax=Rhodoferax saidenbachensis TaxID=1484693 RepID=A0ABU1ZP87_9BURK|nr:EAL domain-containing protein [Rhodoferax saidenbachensis]MDR7307362.1 diguanylate cyclase (GGDEF)-like protein [Rhodoferax saidenbachensis]